MSWSCNHTHTRCCIQPVPCAGCRGGIIQTTLGTTPIMLGNTLTMLHTSCTPPHAILVTTEPLMLGYYSGTNHTRLRSRSIMPGATLSCYILPHQGCRSRSATVDSLAIVLARSLNHHQKKIDFPFRLCLLSCGQGWALQTTLPPRWVIWAPKRHFLDVWRSN